ncbi:MAG: nitrous oxide-stimulated promoter family protein [Xanthomonadales bacterium]|nr:nitrous oxide-stimulated promoter family protein [Xanthomonadales bacterium]
MKTANATATESTPTAVEFRGTAGGLTGRLQRELKTLQCMTDMHCAHHHAAYDGGRCGDCEDLMRYAARRLQKCPYGKDKPTCAKCPVHCYKALQRQQVRDIMRFAGPRMIWRHPWKAVVHIVDKTRQAEHPMKRRRRIRAANSERNTGTGPER